MEDIRRIRVRIALRRALVDAIAGQTDFDPKDRHFRKKVSTISIKCVKLFEGSEELNVTSNG
jgi:hypothetical protein